MGVLVLLFIFPLILCFPFNYFLFPGILRYYTLFTLCIYIYINRISSRTGHIYIIKCLTTTTINCSHIHMYIYIQFLLHVALVPSEQDDKWFMGAVAGNSILLWDLWPGRAKIPLFPLEVLVCAPLLGSSPACHGTIKKEINIDNHVKIVNSILSNVPIPVYQICAFRTPSCECSRKT